jgi:plastocyanin
MRRHGFALGVCLFFASGATAAAQLVVHVSDSGGRPVADAVVTLVPQGDTPSPAQHRQPQVRVIDQKNLMFMPYVQVLRPGDAVVFRNSDRTRHHVYSFSPAKAFEFVLVPGQSSQPLTLANAGVVAVGCNIHDQMATYLYVSQAPWIAQARNDGAAVFTDVPPGTYVVGAWHPRLRPGSTGARRQVVVVSANSPAALTIPLSLLPDRNRHRDPAMLQY